MSFSGEQVQFNMVIENLEVVHEYCPQHLGMGTSRMKGKATEKKEKRARLK